MLDQISKLKGVTTLDKNAQSQIYGQLGPSLAGEEHFSCHCTNGTIGAWEGYYTSTAQKHRYITRNCGLSQYGGPGGTCQ
ncbi:hypothetical protein [Spongiimicrobium salis]|uniref:hypothetical protein n=1 Tax=Spongiimicrobium salis TaxID=1667022 RepID=UPI00374CA835